MLPICNLSLVQFTRLESDACAILAVLHCTAFLTSGYILWKFLRMKKCVSPTWRSHSGIKGAQIWFWVCDDGGGDAFSAAWFAGMPRTLESLGHAGIAIPHRGWILGLYPLCFSPSRFFPQSFSPQNFSPQSFSLISFSPQSFSPHSSSPSRFYPSPLDCRISINCFSLGYSGEGQCAPSA